jgi:hypothetical protein
MEAMMLKKLLSGLFAVALLAAHVLPASAVVIGVDRINATGATAPALTSCGTSPTIVGNDLAGTVTMGTSATGCIITFAVAYPVAPFCVVTWIATPLASQSYATSTTAITLTQTSTSNNVVKYVCIGNAQ